MVGSYSLVQAERTSRSVMDDLPQPPSPQIVMEMGMGGALGFVVPWEPALEAPRARAPAPAAWLDVPADEGILLLLFCGRSRASPVAVVELKVEVRCWEDGVVGNMIESRGRAKQGESASVFLSLGGAPGGSRCNRVF